MLLRGMKLNDRFQMLLSDEEKRSFSEAAAKAGMSLSAWMRQVCRERAGMEFIGARANGAHQ